MSTQVADRLRTLVNEYYHGLVSFESFREQRSALFDSLLVAAAPIVAAPTPPPEVTKPRSADATQTASKKAVSPPAPASVRVAPAASAAGARGGSNRLIVAGAAAVAVVALGLVGYRMLASKPDAAADPDGTARESTALAPGETLLRQFAQRNVWDQDAVRNLEVAWNTVLTEAERQAALASPTYASFGDTLRRRLREEEALGGATASPEFARLVDLATELQMPYAASLARPAPRPGAAPDRAAPDESARPAPAIVNAAPQAPPSEQRVDPETERSPQPRAAAAPVPAPPAPATGAAAGGAAAATPAEGSAATATTNAAGAACSAQLVASRRPFCRDTLRVGGDGPALVVVAPGAFVMGNDQTPNASPAHDVTIGAPFAMSVYEVSFADFERYCMSAGKSCPANPWGDAAFPAVLVSFGDAAAYAEWLSEQSGHRYRLPSEAEWEYAARANTKTPYPFGNEVTPSNARSSALGQVTSPIANTARSVNPNQFRLMNMIGNVREWVADEWHADYSGAPPDGSARLGAAAKSHAVRGGSYADGAPQLRSAARVELAAETRDQLTGFRVLRELGE